MSLETTGDTGLRHGGGFHNLDCRLRLQPGKIGGRLFDLGIGNALLRWPISDQRLPKG
jgi:hypothetical protein